MSDDEMKWPIGNEPIKGSWDYWALFVVYTLRAQNKDIESINARLGEFAELKTTIYGPEAAPDEGLVNRIIAINKSIEDLKFFKIRVYAIATVVGIVGTILGNLIVAVVKSLIDKGG